MKTNTDNIINDIKQKVDEISAEAWTNIQESILDDKTKEAFDVILSILDRLKEFDMPEIAYKLPIPLLLALIRRIQEHESKKLDFFLKINSEQSLIPFLRNLIMHFKVCYLLIFRHHQ